MLWWQMANKSVTSNSSKMVKKAQRKRGRPRAYDREIALTRAMDLFWDRGYAATSLDDLSRAMDMNRPSIYAAFGDKQALYRQALDHYRARVRAAIREVFEESRPLRQVLRDFYERAIDIYLSGKTSARGCFMIGTALTEAVVNPELRISLAETLHGLDRLLAARIAVGQQHGEVDADANPDDLGQVASAMLYLLAIQARAGAARKSLKATMNAALNSICSRTVA
jgi:TetR/AcrR family transcriptional regulator, copper-responsive repressor